MPWQVVREIETHFVITVNGITNGAIARPRNKDTCRGDAPPTAIFDEAAFLQRAFWFDFAYPLFQVKDRIATLITTPPPPGGFFESVVRLISEANKRGDRYFNLQNDSLVCADCLKNRIPERCCHMFGCLPRSVYRRHCTRVLC